MSDPVTVLLVKVASATGVSTLAVSSGMNLIGQAESAASGWLLTGGGLTGITVLIWKLVSDHSTVTRERQASDKQLASARSDVTAAEAKEMAALAEARLALQIANDIWLEAARAGTLLDDPQKRLAALMAATQISVVPDDE